MRDVEQIQDTCKFLFIRGLPDPVENITLQINRRGVARRSRGRGADGAAQLTTHTVASTCDNMGNYRIACNILRREGGLESMEGGELGESPNTKNVQLVEDIDHVFTFDEGLPTFQPLL